MKRQFSPDIPEPEVVSGEAGNIRLTASTTATSRPRGSPPCFRAELKDGRVIVQGQQAAFIGHSLPSGDGIFAEWSWDGSRLVVGNDRYGIQPLFYSMSADHIAISPSIPKLIELGTKISLDEDAISAFLRLGYFLGEDTPFLEIRALPPGAKLEWHPGSEPSITARPPDIRRHNTSYNDAIALYGSLFRRAVERRLPKNDRFTVPLSGGRDSRHILFALSELGYRPRTCITAFYRKPRHNDDARIASAICDRMGIEHVVVEQSADVINEELAKNLITSFCSDEHGWTLSLSRYLAEHFSITYDGIGGDVLSAGLFSSEQLLHLFRTGNVSAVVDKISRTEHAVGITLAQEAHHCFSRQRAASRIMREVVRHVDAPNPVASFYFWNRTRREIALSPYAVMQDVPTVYSPYLDSELFDFLMGLPGEYFTNHQFHSITINSSYPQYADIPYATRFNNSSRASSETRRLAIEMLRYVYKHKRSRFARVYGVAGRLLWLFITGNAQSAWWEPLSVVYLCQLEGVLTNDLHGG